jgi:hypothetical protein
MNMIYTFEHYFAQIQVLGFDSSKYDINLKKKEIASCLELHSAEHQFIVKRNSSYSCLSHEKF